MILYLIRHGDPDYEHDCLTEYGKRQAEALARHLEKEGIQEIYSSPLGRARETASPLAERLHLPVTIEHWAKEMDLTVSSEDFSPRLCINIPTYRLRGEEFSKLGFRWYDAELFQGTPAKEIALTIQNGADDFFRRQGYIREGNLYRAEHPTDKSIALFCHGGIGLTLLAHLCGIPAPLMWANGLLETTGVTKLWLQDYGREYTSPRILYQDNTEHLLLFPDRKDKKEDLTL